MDLLIYEQANLIPPNIVEQLKLLHLGRDGLMWPDFRRLQTQTRPGTVFILQELYTVQAWAIVAKCHIDYQASFFTPLWNRKKGFGRKLYQEAKRLYPDVQVCPWDDTSEAFFNRMEHHHEGLNRVSIANTVFVRRTSEPSISYRPVGLQRRHY